MSKIKELIWTQRDWVKPYEKKIDSSSWHAVLSGYKKYPIDLYEIRLFEDGYFLSATLHGHMAIKDEIKTLDEAKALAQKDWEKFISLAIN